MAADNAFPRARDVVDSALKSGAFPCGVAEVGRAGGPLWTHAGGRLTHAPGAPAASLATIFDLASLTKAIGTTTVALLRVGEGRLAVDDPVAGYIRAWRGEDRRAVTVRDLLEHCSGLPAHRPYYRSISGRTAFEAAVCAEPLAYPPRSQSIYSDPGFMLLGFLLEYAGTATLDLQFNRWRDAVGIAEPLGFNPPEKWRDRTAPTEEDPWRGRLVVGEVHDENAAALGGVAAHAGLFGTAGAVGACARWWLSLLTGHDDPRTGATSEAARVFVQRSSVPGSSRALGWDTMLPTSSCGTRMCERAIGHTGFTGTSLWIDPELNLYAVLLTNRVHPTRDNDAIQPVRRAFHDAVVTDLQEQS